MFQSIDTLVFSGGGNRCFWQAGAIARLQESGWQLPARLVGTSAGATVAASFLTRGPRAALEACAELFARNERMFDWRGVQRLRLAFAHQHTYPAWVASIVNAGTVAELHASGRQMLVAITRPAAWLGKLGSLTAATVAYVVDRKWGSGLHPTLPRRLGLGQEFVNLELCADVGEMQALLNAAAGAPPFMSPVWLQGRWAFDGGYFDNSPLPPKSGGAKLQTLILLTRHDPRRPDVFQIDDRIYWQPSRPVPVSTWNCTAAATVHLAFEAGCRDAGLLLDRGAAGLAHLQPAPYEV